MATTLATSSAAPPPNPDDRVGAVSPVGLGSGGDLGAGRIAADPGKNGHLEAREVGEEPGQHGELGETFVGDEERATDASGEQVLRDLAAGAGPEDDGRGKRETVKRHGLSPAPTEAGGCIR